MPKGPKVMPKRISALDLQREKYFDEVLSRKNYYRNIKRNYSLTMSHPRESTLDLLFTKSRWSSVNRAIYGTRTHGLLFTKQLLYQLS